MPIEEALYSTLSALSPAGGVSPDTSAELSSPEILPRIVYFRVSTVPEETLLGDTPAISQIRMQVDCYETSRLAARDLAARVKTAMVAAATAKIIPNALHDHRDSYDPVVKQYRTELDFMIWA